MSKPFSANSDNEKRASEIFDSDKIHNENCYQYLKNLKVSGLLNSNENDRDFLLKNILPPDALDNLLKILNLQPIPMRTDISYGNIYSQFFKNTEQLLPIINTFQFDFIRQLEFVKNKKSNVNIGTPEYERLNSVEELLKSRLEILQNFIFSIYENQNHILTNTFEHIAPYLDINPTNNNVEHRLATILKPQDQVNTYTPTFQGSITGRAQALLSNNFKPQEKTNVPSIREYNYTKEAPFNELRIGTQAQRHNGNIRISPQFECFLTTQNAKFQLNNFQSSGMNSTPAKKITHIYFNNLARDRTNYEGRKETLFTDALEGLEERHSNIAVITLPADKGLFNRHDYRKRQPEIAINTAKQQMLAVAQQNSKTITSIKDFYISESVRAILFTNSDGHYSKTIENEEIEKLINNSFKSLGLMNRENGFTTNIISKSQKQAVWFHFIKYELPNFAIQKLNPQTFNFTCKDGIDRGGASSAYYNLMRSLELGNPMSRNEFEEALHAAPTLVKGRGMNFHIKLIWNAVDLYLDNQETAAFDVNKKWLIDWRDANCPHERVADILQKRVAQLTKELEDFKASNSNLTSNKMINLSLQILKNISDQSSSNMSGQRLLLEAATKTVSLTFKIANKQNSYSDIEKELQRYEALSKSLDVRYKNLTIIAGLIRQAVDLFKSLFVKNHNPHGEAIKNLGLHADKRRELQEDMKKALINIRNSNNETHSQDNCTPKH